MLFITPEGSVTAGAFIEISQKSYETVEDIIKPEDK